MWITRPSSPACLCEELVLVCEQLPNFQALQGARDPQTGVKVTRQSASWHWSHSPGAGSLPPVQWNGSTTDASYSHRILLFQRAEPEEPSASLAGLRWPHTPGGDLWWHPSSNPSESELHQARPSGFNRAVWELPALTTFTDTLGIFKQTSTEKALGGIRWGLPNLPSCPPGLPPRCLPLGPSGVGPSSGLSWRRSP